MIVTLNIIGPVIIVLMEVLNKYGQGLRVGNIDGTSNENKKETTITPYDTNCIARPIRCIRSNN